MQVEMYFDFMVSSYARYGLLASVVLIDSDPITKRNNCDSAYRNFRFLGLFLPLFNAKKLRH